MKYVATNPVTETTFTAIAENKEAFLLLLVKKAPHTAGWDLNEVRECIEKDLIKEMSVP